MCKLKETTEEIAEWVPLFVQFLNSQLVTTYEIRITCLAETGSAHAFAHHVITCLSDTVTQKVVVNTLTGKSHTKHEDLSVKSSDVSDTHGLVNVQTEKARLKSAMNPQGLETVSPLFVDESHDKLSCDKGERSGGTTWIHFVDVTGSLQADVSYGREELAASSTLISLCSESLKTLPTGGTLVIVMFDCLTRTSVGMLYILHKLFKQISFSKPVCSLESCTRVLVCTEFTGCESNILDHLQCALDRASNALPDQQLLQITGISCLFEKQFLHFICQTNDQILSSRLLRLAKMGS